MTEPDNSSIDNDTEAEVAVLDDTPRNQAVSNTATENQPTTSTRMSFLCLPPEIRVLIYRYVLQIPFRISYDNPRIWRYSFVQDHTGILFTSRLIRREGIFFLFSQNTFTFQRRFSTSLVLPPLRILNMMRNFATEIDISLPSAPYNHLEGFTEIIRAVEDPAIVRGTFSVCFFLDPVYHHHSARLSFFISLLGRLTNFQLVVVNFIYQPSLAQVSLAQSTAQYCDLVENALRSVLGPATLHTTILRGLTFHPQRFLNERGSVNPTHDLDRGSSWGSKVSGRERIKELRECKYYVPPPPLSHAEDPWRVLHAFRDNAVNWQIETRSMVPIQRSSVIFHNFLTVSKYNYSKHPPHPPFLCESIPCITNPSEFQNLFSAPASSATAHTDSTKEKRTKAGVLGNGDEGLGSNP